MKRVMLLAAILVSASAAMADVITFSFIAEPHITNTVTASAAGLDMGPALNLLVSDATTGNKFFLAAAVSVVTGAATMFDPGPPLTASFAGAGAESLLVGTLGHPFLEGTITGGGNLVSTYPDGVGSFRSAAIITFVDPGVLADLHVGPVLPLGSVSMTFAGDSLTGGVMTGTLGGGTVSLTATKSPVDEASTLLLLGGGVLIAGMVGRRTLS